MCQMSCITCHVSPVLCHLSHVICHVSPFFYQKKTNFFFLLLFLFLFLFLFLVYFIEFLGYLFFLFYFIFFFGGGGLFGFFGNSHDFCTTNNIFALHGIFNNLVQLAYNVYWKKTVQYSILRRGLCTNWQKLIIAEVWCPVSSWPAENRRTAQLSELVCGVLCVAPGHFAIQLIILNILEGFLVCFWSCIILKLGEYV